MFKNHLLAMCLILGFSTWSYADSLKDTTVSIVTSVDPNSDAPLTDHDLTNVVRDHLQSNWFKKGYDRLNVKVNNGVVTLQGEVQTAADRDKIENEVSNIKGVKNVDSQLTIQEPPQA